MRILVADCSVVYTGRLGATLPLARRVILVKADGTVLVHADAGSKALNWMSPPCAIEERPDAWTVTGARGERLDIAIAAVHLDSVVELGSEPGLRKQGVEAELQALLAASPDAIEPGLSLITREHATDIGPVDLLCEAADGSLVAVEVKRTGEIDGVEQLVRYLERMRASEASRTIRGILVAQVVKPQARVLAAARGIGWVEVDVETLAGRRPPDLRLF